MSARSIARAHERELRRTRRRRLRFRTAAGTAAAIGAGAIAAPGASAADFQVTNLNDAGAGSLRDALDDANAAAGADTVSFASGLSGRIELTTNALVISDPVAVNGPGPDVITVDGNDDDSVFDVGNLPAPDQAVSISGLSIVGGEDTYGGGIYSAENGGSAAELTVSNVVLKNNKATEYGGGIYQDEGSLTVTDSTISRNFVGDGAGNDYGGGIMVLDTDGDQPVEVTITGTTMKSNNAIGDGGAAYFEEIDNDAVIRNSTFADNISQEDGGALVFSAGGGNSNAVIVDSSTFDNNTATYGAGAIWFLDASQSQLVTDSTFTDNFAGYAGGAIYDDSDETIPTLIQNTTITGNEAGELGGGVYQIVSSPTDTLNISSSIVSGNTAPTGPDLADEETGSTFVVGFSLIGTLSGPNDPVVQSPAGSNRIGVDPQLGPLTDNGGPTQTRLPALSSPAIDAGVANGLTVDQRGLARTVQQPSVPDASGSDGTDIGATELALVDTTVDGAKVKAKKKQKQKGKKIVVKVKAGANEDVTVDAKGSIKAGSKKVKLKKATKQAAAGKTVTLKLKPKSKKGTKQVVKRLDDGKKAKAKLEVTLTDDAGNSTTKKPKVTLIAK